MINSRKIEDLKPEAKIKCEEFIEKCKEANITIKIIQSLRDKEYQQSLYAQGRTTKGPKVTNCDGVKNKSRHQSGLAFDAVPLDDEGTIIWKDDKLYKQMADIGVSIGLVAGYYFRSIKDSPHFEMKQ